jgi:hypothetical protein
LAAQRNAGDFPGDLGAIVARVEVGRILVGQFVISLVVGFPVFLVQRVFVGLQFQDRLYLAASLQAKSEEPVLHDDRHSCTIGSQHTFKT